MQPSREDNTNTISPNLLKNFNVYEILQPKRSNNGPAVDTLIDLNDNTNTSTLTPEINASFVDKTKDYELIDLFQNIFVSPQQIKTKDTKSDEIEPTNIDYGDFFDKLEAGDKIDWSDSQKEMPTSSKSIDLNNSFNIKAKVLVPTIDLGPDSDQEDLADHQKDAIDHVEDFIHQLISSKYIERNKTSQIDNSQPTTSHLVNNAKKLNDPIKLKSTEIENVNIKKHSATESSQLPHLDSQISNSVNDTFIVRAMVKDEKAFRKNRIVKSDREKLNYTKGPDFNEKQIVLPQIMRRLSEREKAWNEEKCWKKRLILDSGTSTPDPCPNCSKTIDNTKLNSSTNIATKSMAFHSLMQPKCTSNSLKITAVPKSSTDIPNSTRKSNNSTIKTSNYSSIKSIKPNLPPNSSTTALKSTVLSKSLGLTSTNGLSNSKASTTASGKSSEAGASSNDIPLGTLQPVVLMEDCNKERLLAWKRSQMISNLVRTGRLYP